MSDEDKRVNEGEKARPALRDPEWWQVAIGIVAIFVSIWIAYYFYSKSQTRKQFEIWLYPNVSLVSVEDRVAKDIEVYYKAERVSNLSSLRFRIINTGNEPIASDDFERPLRFSVSPQATIISARILESHPPNLDLKVTTQPPSDLVVEPALFNEEEWADIELILVDDPTQTALPNLQVDARILGITEIPSKPFPERTGLSSIVSAIVGMAIAAASMLLGSRLGPLIKTIVRNLWAKVALQREATTEASHPIRSAAEEGLITHSAKYGTETKAVDLQEVMRGATCQKLEPGASRIFHAPCPYVLPVCFEHPERSEYTYVVVSATADDERDRIVTEPKTATCDSMLINGYVRWYRLTSDKPLKSIKLGNRPRIENFRVVKAQIHPIEAWNKHAPVTVPGNRSRAYGLAITEEKGSSTWFVSIDDRPFTFTENLGCHFVEFVLSEGQQHNLSLGYKEGAWGIASAFFAF